jgi:hypothetical protein
MIDLGTNDQRLINAVLVHFVQKLLNDAPAFRIGDRWFIGPVSPGMAVAINN